MNYNLSIVIFLDGSKIGSIRFSSAYSNTSACFIKKLQELLEDEYEDFESLDKVEKLSYVLYRQ